MVTKYAHAKNLARETKWDTRRVSRAACIVQSSIIWCNMYETVEAA